VRLLPPAFERCGLYPIDADKVISRLPTETSSREVARALDSSLLKTLEKQRYGDGRKKARAPRGKKIPAGQSYSAQRPEEEEEEEEDRPDSVDEESSREDDEPVGPLDDW